MTKFFAIASALLIALTAFASAADAGCGGKHKRGFGKFNQSFSHNHKAKKRALARKRAAAAAKRRAIAQKKAAAKRKAIAAKKAAAKRRAIAAKKAAAKKARIAAAKAKQAQDEIKVSKVDDTPFDKPVSVAAVAGAVTEFTNDNDTAIDNDTQEVASNEEVGCKKYIPSAGLTINVPCAN